jgi:hypothetical protein
MPLPSLTERSIPDLTEEQVNLERLYKKVEENEKAMQLGDWSTIKRAIRQAIEAIEHEIDERVDRMFESGPPSPNLIRMAEWLGQQIRDAEQQDPMLAGLKRQVREATAALEGLEGDALARALRVQDKVIWALIKRTSASRNGTGEGEDAA